MKKKIICLGLALMLGAALAACGGSEKKAEVSDTDYNALKTVQDKMASIKDAELKITLETAIKAGDAKEEQKSKTTAVIQEILSGKDDTDMKITVDSNTAGLAQKGTIYIKDGVAYVDSGKQKIKTESTGAYTQMATAAQKLIASMEREDLQAIKKEETDNPVFQLTMDKDKVIGDLYASAGISEEYQEESGKIKVKDAKIQLAAGADDLPETIVFSGTYEMPYGESAVTVVYQYTSEFIKANTGMQIDFPDFAGYQNADGKK